jgi:L-lactate dehydrogenase complex protein LldF
MERTSHAFKESAARALQDATLQKALDNMRVGFVDKRRKARERLPEFERLRDLARDIKDHTLKHLDFYLEAFEARVKAQGGEVHWCRTPAEARQVILEICRRAEARTVTKGKSMIAEEIALNEFLEANGIEPVETDLGEYIIQLAHEPPSHIIAPAIHKTRDQVSDLFFEHHRQYGKTRRLEETGELVDEARQVLRPKYVAADVGITGANFLVAETGSVVIVTNEGNSDLTRTLPKVHIVTASLEKFVPNTEDVWTILRLLARSATGQELSTYTTFASGPRQEGELDGPGEFHVVLLDNGRSEVLGTEFQDILRCIRCAACLNHCPVYRAIGGHAYGWVYSGPMGAVLTPMLIGIEEAGHLPNASSFCGRCEAVCPMRIPLPRMMRRWREREFEGGHSPPAFRRGLKLWAWLARRPRLYGPVMALAVGLMARLAGRRHRFRALPLAGGWTDSRDFPAPEGERFMAMWRARRAARGGP